MRNKVRVLREALGLSQKQLADRLGTSQQQVARIESGSTSVKIDTAFSLAVALETSIESVFPATKKLLGRGRKKVDRSALVELHYNPSKVAEFEEAGVDLDPATWLVALRIRGGARVDFVLSTAEASRLRTSLNNYDPSSPFIVLRSSKVAFAVNRKHLMHYHELWDKHVDEAWHDPRVPSDSVAAFFCDSPEPETIECYPDEGDPDDPDDDGQLRTALSHLETAVEDDEYLILRDIDGEDAFFRIADLALLTIPLRDIDPNLDAALLDQEMSETGEEDDTAELSAETAKHANESSSSMGGSAENN